MSTTRNDIRTNTKRKSQINRENQEPPATNSPNKETYKEITEEEKNLFSGQDIENDNNSSIKVKFNKNENKELNKKSKKEKNKIFKKNFNYSKQEISSNIIKKNNDKDKREITNINQNKNKIGYDIKKESKKVHVNHSNSFEYKFDILIDELRTSNKFMHKILKQNLKIVRQNNVLIHNQNN